MCPTTYRIEHPDEDAASQWEDEGGHVEEGESSALEAVMSDDQNPLEEE